MTSLPLEPSEPWPPRFRWLKRGGVMGLIVLIALAVLRWQWDLAADRRIKQFVDEAHARGEPAVAEDFVRPDVPDSENAAIPLQKAANLVMADQQFLNLEASHMGGPLSAGEIAQFRTIKTRRADVLELCRTARLKPKADWRVPINGPLLLTPLKYLNSQRGLANFLRFTAQYDLQTGDSQAFVERCRDLLRQGRAVGDSFPCLVAWLVGCGIDSMAAGQIDQQCLDLQVRSAGVHPQAGVASAEPEQIEALISDLLDQRPFIQAASRAWRGEGASGFQLPELITQADRQQPPVLAFGIWLARPMIDLDGLRIAMRSSRISSLVAMPNWPGAANGLPVGPSTSSYLQFVSQLMSRTLAGSEPRGLQVEFRRLGERRAAAVQLAIQLYRARHAGKLPPSLQALAPEFLPYVPEDPFAPIGTPMHYRPELNPPIIYSVGPDGVDNHGTTPPFPPGKDRWECPDAIWIVGPAAPTSGSPPNPSSKAQDH